MPIKYKIDIMPALKEKGYSSTRIRNEAIFGMATVGDFRHGKVVYGKTLEKLCKLLNCQPGDILEYVPDDDADQPEG